MIVKELIEKLKQYPDEMEIFCYGESEEYKLDKSNIYVCTIENIEQWKNIQKFMKICIAIILMDILYLDSGSLLFLYSYC